MLYLIILLVAAIIVYASVKMIRTPMAQLMPGETDTPGLLLPQDPDARLVLRTRLHGVDYAATPDGEQPVKMKATIEIEQGPLQVFVFKMPPPEDGYEDRRSMYEVNVHIKGRPHCIELRLKRLLAAMLPAALPHIKTWPKDLDDLDLDYSQGRMSFTYIIPKKISPPSTAAVEQGWEHVQGLIQTAKDHVRPVKQWLTDLADDPPSPQIKRVALLALCDAFPESKRVRVFWKHVASYANVDEVLIAYEVNPAKAQKRVRDVESLLTLLEYELKDDRAQNPSERSASLLQSVMRLVEHEARSPELDALLTGVLTHAHGAVRAALAQRIRVTGELSWLPLLLQGPEVAYQHQDEADLEADALISIWYTHAQTLDPKDLASYALARIDHHTQRAPHMWKFFLVLRWFGDYSIVEALRARALEASWAQSAELIEATNKDILDRLRSNQDGGQLSLAAQGPAGGLTQTQGQGDLTLKD